MDKWELLKNIQAELKTKKLSIIKALSMLEDAIEIHVESNINIEYEAFIDELKKLKSLTEKINAIIEENNLLEAYNEKLLQFARMSDEELEKNRQHILKLL